MLTQQGFPQISAPFVDSATGLINQTWLQLLIALWNRTGQGPGDIIDITVYTGLVAAEFPEEITAHTNLWTANQYFNYIGGGITTFRNTNALTANARNTGWFSNSALAGNFILNQGRSLIGEAVINGGKNSANGEWVETLSSSTITLAQTGSVNTTGGIGLLGASRTSEAPSAGVSFNQGTQGITSVVYNDNTSALQTCYGYYGEAWKAATARAENIAHGCELTTINLYATAAQATPYSPSPNGLIETLRVATGKGASGNEASTAISIVGTGGATAVFRNGIIIADNALNSAKRAINLAKGHLFTWFKPDGSGGSHIRSDVDTGELGYRIAFGNATVNFQDESNVDLWTFGTPPNGSVLVNEYCAEFHGAIAYLNAVQSIADSTNTAISFNATNYDTDSFWTGGSPTRITIPTGLGITKVRLSANLQYDNNTTGSRTIQINKNGSGVYIGRVGMAGSAASSGGGFSLNGSTAVISVVDGDYFELNTSQNSGGALNAQATNTWLSIEVIT